MFVSVLKLIERRVCLRRGIYHSVSQVQHVSAGQCLWIDLRRRCVPYRHGCVCVVLVLDVTLV